MCFSPEQPSIIRPSQQNENTTVTNNYDSCLSANNDDETWKFKNADSSHILFPCKAVTLVNRLLYQKCILSFCLFDWGVDFKWIIYSLVYQSLLQLIATFIDFTIIHVQNINSLPPYRLRYIFFIHVRHVRNKKKKMVTGPGSLPDIQWSSMKIQIVRILVLLLHEKRRNVIVRKWSCYHEKTM